MRTNKSVGRNGQLTLPAVCYRLANQLRRLREAQGLSQEELALKAGVSPAYISHLERPIKEARISAVDKLAQALGVQPGELLTNAATHQRPQLDSASS